MTFYSTPFGHVEVRIDRLLARPRPRPTNRPRPS